MQNKTLISFIFTDVHEKESYYNRFCVDLDDSNNLTIGIYFKHVVFLFQNSNEIKYNTAIYNFIHF